MRRGITLSLLLHLAMGIFFFIELPSFVMPEKEIKMMNVTLTSMPSKNTNSKQKAKIKKPKKIYSQQSAAPKNATKKKVKKQKADHKTKILKTSKKKKATSKKVIKKKKVKKEKQQEESPNKAIPKKKQISTRPEKLDKTPNKKNILKSEDKKDKKKKDDDDFLSTLNFIDDLEKEQKGSVKGEDDAPKGQTFNADQVEIARIRKQIESNWYKTAGANKQRKLEAVVELDVDRDGSVNKVEVVESSGFGYFDRGLQRAIRKSSPLAIPAGKYEIYKTIILTFRS
ncbi:MAG: TonB C-terminal domain-containing protein [Proteobacteria bacterium]|nr:TonB C-terminal domain-containing protein [Pseudomonadota bacterium]